MVCLLIAMITLLVYLPARNHEFLMGSDEGCVTDNPVVQGGITPAGVKWAFTTFQGSTWQPVTWLSHMLDCRYFGLAPSGPHLVNVAFHAVNLLLLFALLVRTTQALWPSALITALFAWHPLQVESVAWVSERGQLLSAFFGLLSLVAYVEYVMARKEKTRHPLRHTLAMSVDYGLALLFFALGLMSQPSLAVLPLAMLVMDYWPLQRGGSGRKFFESRWPRLIMEKWPFLALAAGAVAMALMARQPDSASVHFALGPLSWRAEAAGGICGLYLLRTVWPVHLAVVYPFVRQTFWLGALAGGTVAIFISWWIWRARQRRPYLVAGWLWFLVMLLPVVLTADAGTKVTEDHDAYLALVGLFIGIGFGAAEIVLRFQLKPVATGLATGAGLAGCLLATSAQLWYWGNSERLFTHALAVTEDNPVAHDLLGEVRLRQGRAEDAIPEFQKALELDPDDAKGHNDLGEAYLQQGKVEEATRCFDKALYIHPNYTAAHNNLGMALLRSGKVDEALAEFLSAVETQSDDPLAHENLGLVFLENGHLDNAIVQFQKALRLRPNRVESRFNLGIAFLRKGRLDDAIECFEKVLDAQADHLAARSYLAGALLHRGRPESAAEHYQAVLDSEPDNVGAGNNLAWILATSPKVSLRNGAKAIELAEQAERLSLSNSPTIIGTVAAAYAEAGRFPDAVAAARRALHMAAAQHDTPDVKAITSQLGCYEAGYAFRDSNLTNTAPPAILTLK
jgi:tetratricopeptide (TPR) repeat protein